MGRGGAGRGRGRSKGGAVIAAALLVALAGAGPASANPAPGATSKVGGPVAAVAAFSSSGPNGPSSPNLRLDGRAAGRLLADAKEADPSAPATEDDKGKPPEKSDEIKMTVTKGPAGAGPKQAAGSDDTFAFLKDWPFWAAVGGVVIVGAAVFLINRNSNQEHSCSATYNAGCFGAK